MKELTLTTREQSRIQVFERSDRGQGDSVPVGETDGSERAPYVATAGSVQRGGSSCRGTREQGEWRSRSVSTAASSSFTRVGPGRVRSPCTYRVQSSRRPSPQRPSTSRRRRPQLQWRPLTPRRLFAPFRRSAPVNGREIMYRRGGLPPTCPSTSGPRSSALRG